MPRGMQRSAIEKLPVREPVRVEPLGLDGDDQADRRFHGGPRKAVYVYASEDLAWWSQQLGRVLAPGFIGENLTTAGLDLGELRAGDRLHAGDVILEVTEPRDPCAKLQARLGLPGFIKRFGRAGRSGVYCSVVRPGTLRAGDPMTVVRGPLHGPTIRELNAARFGTTASAP